MDTYSNRVDSCSTQIAAIRITSWLVLKTEFRVDSCRASLDEKTIGPCRVGSSLRDVVSDCIVSHLDKFVSGQIVPE